MSDISEQISFIKDKVIQLVSDNQNLKTAYDELSLQLEALQNEQKKKDEKISLLENQIETLESEKKNVKTVDTIAPSNISNGISEKEIDKMIKEIDECLALLDI